MLVLGVRRSGTTLLRVMLDRNPALAVPDESYFVPTLARRHGDRPDLDAFVDDLRRLRTIVEWELDPAEIRARLRPGATLGEAVSAVYEAYAARRGKERWGDKTPMYMQHLPLLERLFPDARFVHLIRDGRDAARLVPRPAGGSRDAHVGPPGLAGRLRVPVARRGRGRARARPPGRRPLPRGAIRAARRRPGPELRRICDFAGLPWDAGMLEYAGQVDVSAKPHQQNLARPPTPGLRDWRRELSRRGSGGVRRDRRRPAGRARLPRRGRARERRPRGGEPCLVRGAERRLACERVARPALAALGAAPPAARLALRVENSRPRSARRETRAASLRTSASGSRSATRSTASRSSDVISSLAAESRPGRPCAPWGRSGPRT